jgi:hypothetical protein
MARLFGKPGLVLLAAGWCACGPKYLSRAQLLDPTTCGACHVQHATDWAASMHAYASDDPVFRAMNQRGQRETAGQLGVFCVNCHAPMAVRDGATTDGLNLDAVPSSLHGVTCYFCHSVESVDGGHDDPLLLSDDLVMRGELSDAISNSAHATVYSDLLDREQPGSATLCGSCHDVVTGHGASIERTFQEWQASVFSQPAPALLTCSGCHMQQSPTTAPIAQYAGAPPRYYYAHSWPAVDVVLPPPGSAPVDLDAGLAAANASFLRDTLQSALCFEPGIGSIQVTLDNAGSGHDWPSGATQDRRAWVEIVAYVDGGVSYANGVVPPGGDVTQLVDGGVWLMRDCMFDDAGTQVDMFWQAASTEGNELPPLATFDVGNPAFYKTHIRQSYYAGPSLQGSTPDVITATVILEAMGHDVLEDLVDSGDLDAGYVSAVPVYAVNSMKWTPADESASTCPDLANPGGTMTPCRYIDSVTGQVVYCASTTVNVNGTPTLAQHNADCLP